MPHKHTRKESNKNDFDLAPTTLARPLPTVTKTTPKSQPKKQLSRGAQKAQQKKASEPAKDLKPKKRKRGPDGGDYGADDTPRAFARLMAQAGDRKKLSGLDDGEGKKKKVKKTTDAEKNGAGDLGAEKKTNAPVEAKKKEAQSQMPDLKILPGEKMSDFSARVNQAMPVSGLARKGKVQIEGLKERRTKTEKRMHKMYDAWRVEEAKRKEREEEAREKAEEEDEEKEALYGGQSVAFPDAGEGGRKGKRRREIGEAEDREGDPWAVLREKRGGRAKLGDVVQAPPELKVVPKEKFKVKGGARVDVANVPNAAGSLKKREELGDARREVIERYRSMMRGNKD